MKRPILMTAVLTAWILAPSLSADEKLPTLRELDQFIQRCQQLQAKSGTAKPAKAKPPVHDKPHSALGLTRAQREQAAFKLARELTSKPGAYGKEKGLQVLKQLKALDVPGIMAQLHPLLVVRNTQEERRWVAFQLGKHYLPKIFRLEKGTEETSYRIAFHSPLHKAYRKWLRRMTGKQHKLARDVINSRVRYVLGRIEKLKGATEKSAADELAKQLIQQGEEWVVWDLTLIFNQAAKHRGFTRRFAGRVIRYYMGAQVKVELKPRLFRANYQQRNKQTNAYLRACSYCTYIAKRRRR